MSYELAIASEAEEDLLRLVDSLPKRHRDAAWDAVVVEPEKLAANPDLALRSTIGRPTFRFRFTLGEVGYPWAATFKYGEDERTIVITHVFRVPL
jgi:hypothetical protein